MVEYNPYLNSHKNKELFFYDRINNKYLSTQIMSSNNTGTSKHLCAPVNLLLIKGQYVNNGGEYEIIAKPAITNKSGFLFLKPVLLTNR